MNQKENLTRLVVFFSACCLALAAQATTVTKTFPAGETGNLIVNVAGTATVKTVVLMTAEEVDQAVQNELRARNRWISAIQSYQSQTDSFKSLLGFSSI